MVFPTCVRYRGLPEAVDPYQVIYHPPNIPQLTQTHFSHQVASLTGRMKGEDGKVPLTDEMTNFLKKKRSSAT